MATSKTRSRTLDPDPEKPGSEKARHCNADAKVAGCRKTIRRTHSMIF